MFGQKGEWKRSHGERTNQDIGNSAERGGRVRKRLRRAKTGRRVGVKKKLTEETSGAFMRYPRLPAEGESLGGKPKGSKKEK